VIADLRYELVRLRTLRSTYWLVGLGLVLNAALAGIIAYATRDLTEPGVVAAFMTSGSAFSPLPFLAVLVGLLGAFAFGHEYRHRTITATLTATPRRSLVVAAKVLVTVALAVVVAIVGLVLNWAVSSIVSGRVVHALTPELRPVMAGFVLYVVLWGVMGVALGLLIRNLPVVVTFLFLIPLVIEPLLSALGLLAIFDSVSGALRYLPFAAGARLMSFGDSGADGAGADDPLSRTAGGLTFAVWTAVVLAVGWYLFRRRDA